VGKQTHIQLGIPKTSGTQLASDSEIAGGNLQLKCLSAWSSRGKGKLLSWKRPVS